MDNPMRLFSVLALTSILSAPAFAADLGTYRPGAPYHSVIAPAADVCENQCAGDAQCRGWNYVKVNPRAPGVCEFNSKPASPIESSISISGQGASIIAPNLSVGATNTVRVGTAPATTRRSTVHQVSPRRRVVRQAIPQQIRPEQTVARRPIQNRQIQNGSLTAQQNLHRQSTGHVPTQLRHPNPVQQRAALPQYQQRQARPQAIQGRQVAPPQQRLLQDPRIQQQYRSQRPQFNHNLDGAPQQLHRPRSPQQSQPQFEQNLRQKSQGRPPIGVQIANSAPQAAIPKASANNPVTHQNGQARIHEAEIIAAQRAAQIQAAQIPNVSLEQAQSNLFGSLNDDVNVPRPLLSLPADQSAPISTSQARPTTPVIQEPLGVLAGG